MTDVFIRRGETQRRPYDDGGIDWNEAATSQVTPRISSNHQRLGERHGTDFLSESVPTMN